MRKKLPLSSNCWFLVNVSSKATVRYINPFTIMPYSTTKKEDIIKLNTSSNLITTRTTVVAYQTSWTIVPTTTTTLPKSSLKPSSSPWTTTILNSYSPSSKKVTTISNLQTTHIESKTTDHLFKIRHRHR